MHAPAPAQPPRLPSPARSSHAEPPGGHTITALVGGDFNQAVPRIKGQPHQAYERLTTVLGLPAWTIVTAGATAPNIAKSGADPVHRPLIDHLALNAPLTATAAEGIPNHDQDGHRLSDHTGCVVRLAKR